MDKILQRLDTLEVRSKRDHRHLLDVIGSQRERFEKAFDEMKLAWLEQELALRQYAQQSRQDSEDLRDTVRELAESVDQRLTRLEEGGSSAA